MSIAGATIFTMRAHRSCRVGKSARQFDIPNELMLWARNSSSRKRAVDFPRTSVQAFAKCSGAYSKRARPWERRQHFIRDSKKVAIQVGVRCSCPSAKLVQHDIIAYEAIANAVKIAFDLLSLFRFDLNYQERT